MKQEGPPLVALTRRLSECPVEFLDAPRLGKSGLLHVDAIVADLLRDLGAGIVRPEARRFAPGTGDAKVVNYLRVVSVSAWLLHDGFFRNHGNLWQPALDFLQTGLADVCQLVNAESFTSDPDRREELVRLALRTFDMRPKGESVAQAEDRLKTLSSVERQRVIQATRAASERSKQVLEAMRKKATEAAAAKVSRE